MEDIRTSMTVALDEARFAWRFQTFSMLLGAELISLDSAGVELRVPITDKINYLRPAKGEALVARAAVINAGR